MNTSAAFNVTVDLGIALARQVRGTAKGKPRLVLRLTHPSTVGQLVEMLGIPREYISFITVNGEKKDWVFNLGTDDHIILFPYIAGG